MGQDDRDARWFEGFTAEEWALWHVLCEIWALQGLLPEERAAAKGEGERREEERRAVATLLGLAGLGESRPGGPWPGERTALTPRQRHLLAQLRLLSALTPPDRPDHLKLAALTNAESRSSAILRPAGHPTAPRTPNLTTEGLAAPPSAFDALLTLTSGVVQVFTGFHVLGGIAAMLHGVCRLASPDSPLTTITSTIRKVLAPDITVIQESVKMMAPLPDNERSGLRDALCLAAHEVTGLEVGALKHQLFPPRETELDPQTQIIAASPEPRLDTGLQREPTAAPLSYDSWDEGLRPLCAGLPPAPLPSDDDGINELRGLTF